MRIILRIVLSPVVLVLWALELVIDGGLKVYSFAAALFYKLLAICVIVAVIGQNWTGLGILGVLFLLSISVILFGGVLMGILAGARDGLKSVM
ncbi:MAG: hypothetical protein HUJ70_13345 [Pseudobutyrivibrio sp.]|nr:hypothetical protein [Pseudobutyrivibrio sp.]